MKEKLETSPPEDLMFDIPDTENNSIDNKTVEKENTVLTQ